MTHTKKEYDEISASEEFKRAAFNFADEIKTPTQEERDNVREIIRAFEEYAFMNKCDLSLLYKPKEDETEVTFSESGFVLEFVVSWRRESELENVEIYDSESDQRDVISFEEFIKCYKNFIDQEAF